MPLDHGTACGIISAMTQAKKRLERMAANPNSGWTIDDVIAVCKPCGVSCAPPKRGGHYKVSHSSQIDILTIPSERPIKAVYIKSLVAFLMRVTGAQADG